MTKLCSREAVLSCFEMPRASHWVRQYASRSFTSKRRGRSRGFMEITLLLEMVWVVMWCPLSELGIMGLVGFSGPGFWGWGLLRWLGFWIILRRQFLLGLRRRNCCQANRSYSLQNKGCRVPAVPRQLTG